jgi:hypothetical protein
MNNDYVKERLKRLNLTEDMYLEIQKTVVSLPTQDAQNNLLSLIEKTTLQHYVREFMKQNMI